MDRFLQTDAPQLIRPLLTLQVAGFGRHPWRFPPDAEPPTTTDFASFYAAGAIANQGAAGAAYDPVAHEAAEAAAGPSVTEPGTCWSPAALTLPLPACEDDHLVRLPGAFTGPVLVE
jgi:hypothetical protein